MHATDGLGHEIRTQCIAPIGVIKEERDVRGPAGICVACKLLS